MARREGARRDNWLLIKQHDAYAIDDPQGKLLADAKSVASARTMEQITNGKGRRPRPFMLSKPGAAKAVWHSRGSSK